jgi:DNA processing protein
MKVNTLTLKSSSYPALLKTIHQPPAQIYYRGADPAGWLGKPKLAVVGSRKMTAYGRSVTEKMVAELAHAGVAIVSGLAYGVDAAAHKAALGAGGLTAAVLGSNIDEIRPTGNQQLAAEILKHGGTIMSEYRGRSLDYRVSFVARNRIVSGLADVLLITEAALKSGSLHTARFALEQGKTVMAVPGSIFSPSSEGCNNLIKSGAIPVTSANDVFFALGIEPETAKVQLRFEGSPREEKIFKLICEGFADQEDLAVAASLDGAQVSSALTTLEIGGYIRPQGGGRWSAA